MKNTILLLFIIFSFSACSDDDSVFGVSTEGLVYCPEKSLQ